ncbi:hypothetical protein PTSG_05007 [Salpingoeca rosetta]|uniref:Ras-GAP domain-containing protein n=1 Tax=Salpingoeca rosetta (strain ATCC 50818 / BSB-021) TaxID=946362 RepID=F2U988_SALR5|nr:uncharacterized protein PTSG_05007 [Salpingoeca rosetta]EGD73291.1 hypothetical protein PTSG_05007 [Salpingoeca rosetta]|eukprot:XP_004994322.1 hypothetical protein PTSG_05007 [Salpingoeca rosetta]
MANVSRGSPARRDKERGSSFWRFFHIDKPHLEISEATFADVVTRPLPTLPTHESTTHLDPRKHSHASTTAFPFSPGSRPTTASSDAPPQSRARPTAGAARGVASPAATASAPATVAASPLTSPQSAAATASCSSSSSVLASPTVSTSTVTPTKGSHGRGNVDNGDGDGDVTASPAALRRLVESAYRLPLRLRMHWLAVPDSVLREASIPAAQLVTALSHNSFALAKAICTVDGFLTHQTAKWLLTLLESAGVARPFLTSVIKDDINNERAAPMVFRRNTTATRLVSAYFRLIGHDFLCAVLAAPVQNACNSDPIEQVNVRQTGDTATASNRSSGGGVSGGNGAMTPDRRLVMLVGVCQDVCDLLTHNTARFPLSLALLTKDLFDLMEARFPGHGIVVIRSFVFLRLLCPALINPEAFNLLDSKPDPVHHQTLLMMAKLIQSLANFTGAASEVPLPSAIDSPVVRQFIDWNRAGMADLVQQLLARAMATQDGDVPASCQRLADLTAPALWFCPSCNHVNRSDRSDCRECGAHAHRRASNEHTRSHAHAHGHGHGHDPAAPAHMHTPGHGPQLNLLDRCAINLAHLLETKLADIVKNPDTLEPCTVSLECNAKELFLEASMASLGSASVSLGANADTGRASDGSVGSGGVGGAVASSHREFDELVLTDDAIHLHRALDLALTNEKLAHASVVMVVSRGIGLRFLVSRLASLLDALSTKTASACKAFLARWCDPAASIADVPEALCLEHCAAAYSRITIPSTARQMVAALLGNAASHLRSVEGRRPSVEVVASLVATFIKGLMSEKPGAVLQQWSPGLVRLALISTAAFEQRDQQWAVLFMQGLLARCLLTALVSPRRFGVFDRNVPLDFRRGLHTTACTALEPRLLLAWLSSCRFVAQRGWFVAAHEYHTFHAMCGWRGVLGVSRSRCRRVLLARFKDIFLRPTSGESEESSGDDKDAPTPPPPPQSSSAATTTTPTATTTTTTTTGHSGSGEQHDVVLPSASSSNIGGVKTATSSRAETSPAASPEANNITTMISSTSSTNKVGSPRRRAVSHASAAVSKQTATPEQELQQTKRIRRRRRRRRRSRPQQRHKVLVESHTFRLIDPLVIAIYAVTQLHSRIASPLMSPNTHSNDYLELDLWATSRSKTASVATTTAAPTPRPASVSAPVSPLATKAPAPPTPKPSTPPLPVMTTKRTAMTPPAAEESRVGQLLPVPEHAPFGDDNAHSDGDDDADVDDAGAEDGGDEGDAGDDAPRGHPHAGDDGATTTLATSAMASGAAFEDEGRGLDADDTGDADSAVTCDHDGSVNADGDGAGAGDEDDGGGDEAVDGK